MLHFKPQLPRGVSDKDDTAQNILTGLHETYSFCYALKVQ